MSGILGNLGFAEHPIKDDAEFDNALKILCRVGIDPLTRPIQRERMSRTFATFSEIEQSLGPPDGAGWSTSHHGLRRYNTNKLIVIDFGEFRVTYRDRPEAAK